MLLSLVLSSLLVAQAGEFPVIDVAGLGLARGASTEGAEGLSGEFEQSIPAELMTAGGADHLAHHIPEAVPSGIRCDDLTGLLKTTPGPVDIVHSRVVEIIVGIADGVEQIGKRGKEVFGSSEKADVLLGLGGVHGLFLLRDIPPVPGPLGSGRGERSLVQGFHLASDSAVKGSVFLRPLFGDTEHSLAHVLPDPLPALVPDAHCFGNLSESGEGRFVHCLALLAWRDCHEQRLEQALAQVNIESRTTNCHLRKVAA